MPATLKFPQFTAVVRDGRWRVGDAKNYKLARSMVAEFNYMADQTDRSPADPCRDLTLAQLVAHRFGGRVLSAEAPPPIDPTVVY